MKKALVLIAAGALFATAVYALPDYEPFADATAGGGTTYAVGANLIGQTNAQGQTWYQAGPISTTLSKIVAGNLSYGELPASQGNSVNFGGTGESARLNLNGGTITSGTIYYSFLLQITAVSSANTGAAGLVWAGFNNALGSQSGTPSVMAAQIKTKMLTSSTFALGTSKASTVASDCVWDPITRSVGDTLFVVGSYTLNSGSSSDDVSQMWINPAIGSATPPAATLTASTGGDISSGLIASFVLENRDVKESSGIMDELRFGTWADVTAVPEPSTVVLAGFGALALVSWYRARRC
jgi:hypothetical protein